MSTLRSPVPLINEYGREMLTVRILLGPCARPLPFHGTDDTL